jgi:hypothetical protein
MGDTSDKAKNSTVCVHIAKALFDRVETFCTSKKMTPEEFIFDAVSEKLSSVYKERRRKQRL